MSGGHRAMFRAVPAREHLEADEILRRQRNDRLIEGPDFAAGDGGAKIGLHSRARLQRDVHFGVEEAKGAAPRALAVIHRDVRGVQQGVGIRVSRLREGDADRRVHLDMPAIPGNGSSHCRHDLSDQAGDGFPIVAKRDQRDKFVAAETSGRAPRRQKFVQSIGNRAENGVAGRVAVQVVDRLKSIEIDEDDGERSSVRAIPQGSLERLMEQSTVREPRQSVVPRGLFGERFGGDAGRDSLSQQNRFANRRRYGPQAHAAAQHHEVHQVVLDRETAEPVEDAEPRADEPSAGPDDHKHQEFVKLALSPSPTFFEDHRGQSRLCLQSGAQL